MWLALSAFFAFALGLLAAAGPSGAQTNDGAFLLREGTPPPGANDPSCRPSAEHPYPVVLVHGTFETMDQNWAVLSPRLRAAGYCVYALNYGNRGLGPIQDSARELDRFVDGVLGLTGARKVSLVGHSQGGMMPRYWIKYLGGKVFVDDLVGIAPSNYGTELGQPDFRAALGIPNPCVACEQQRAGSQFLRRLNAGDDTPGTGSFTQIATDDDEIIVPYTRCFLRGERRTENVTLQDYNAGLPVTHQNIYNDPFAQRLVFDALDNPGPRTRNAPSPRRSRERTCP
ncbi:esterase/lipase family protein [Rubrobacter marinus]|uniref:esterase/lipase family protein n=1 Tax=Rubrobacter marinus TaxID=2653852 RepID=UPI00140D5519|nr:alpha/beta fold hydrolase [Rubrobacter marinus]